MSSNHTEPLLPPAAGRFDALVPAAHRIDALEGELFHDGDHRIIEEASSLLKCTYSAPKAPVTPVLTVLMALEASLDLTTRTTQYANQQATIEQCTR